VNDSKGDIFSSILADMIPVLTNKYLIFNECTKEYIASYLTLIDLTRKLLFIAGLIQLMFFSEYYGLIPDGRWQ